MNNILQFKPIVEEPLTLTASMFDITYMNSKAEDHAGIKYFSYWVIIEPIDAYKKYFKSTLARSDKIIDYSGNTISDVVSAKLITIKDVEVTITFNITGSMNSCSGSVQSFSPTSIMIPGNQFDGHLTAESFIITPHVHYDRIDLDLGNRYYSYYATVDVNFDLQSFFELLNILPLLLLQQRRMKRL